MRNFARLLILVMLAAPGRLAAQEVQPGRPAPSVGVVAGLGSGPVDAATWGVTLVMPVWRYLSLRAEYSHWGNGLGGTTCVPRSPDSYRCSASGVADLAGVAANIPVEGRLGVFGEISGGRFTRNWSGGEVSSAALSMEAGARVRIFGGLSARFGGRFLRAFDDDYETMLGERLQYTMGNIGLEYSIAW